MIQINLLPVRVQKRKDSTNLVALAYLISVFIALAVIVILDLSYSRAISSRQAKLAAVKSEVNKYQVYQVQLQKLTAAKNAIDNTRQVIETLKGDRDAVVRMLALLSIKVPLGKIWFESLTENGETVTLDGVAESNEAIVKFMRNLRSSPYIDTGSTNLVLSRQFQLNDMKLRKFQLAYRFHTYSATHK